MINKEPKIEIVKSGDINVEEIMNLSPKELVDHLLKLEERGELDGFIDKAMNNESLLAQMSYWEKWLKKRHQELLEDTIAKKKEMYADNSELVPLNLESKFSPEELELVLNNVRAIQLTYGCSKACPFCGFDAVKGVREHIPYSEMANLFQKYGKFLKNCKPLLYWASEPSDYVSKEGLEDRTYIDVHELAVNYAGYRSHITTKENADEEWINFIKDKDFRVSVYGLKKEEVEKIKILTNQWQENKILGQGEKHKKGIGLSQSKHKEDKIDYGIACKDGLILTPRGLYNAFYIPINDKNPQGQYIEPFEKIGNREIKVGENIKTILREAVVLYVNERIQIRERGGDFANPYPLKMLLQNKRGVSAIVINEDGDIIKVEQKNEIINLKVTEVAEEARTRNGINLIFFNDQSKESAKKIYDELLDILKQDFHDMRISEYKYSSKGLKIIWQNNITFKNGNKAMFRVVKLIGSDNESGEAEVDIVSHSH